MDVSVYVQEFTLIYHSNGGYQVLNRILIRLNKAQVIKFGY